MPEKPSKLMPALYGGVIMGVISGIPFLNLVNCLCCAGVMLGGFMAVFFYQKDLTPEKGPLTNSDSLQLGALAGVFGALVGLVLTVIFHFALGAAAGEATGEDHHVAVRQAGHSRQNAAGSPGTDAAKHEGTGAFTADHHSVLHHRPALRV